MSSAAALILAENEYMSPIDIKHVIIESAKQYDSIEGVCLANGCLDIDNALKEAEKVSEK